MPLFFPPELVWNAMKSAIPKVWNVPLNELMNASFSMTLFAPFILEAGRDQIPKLPLLPIFPPLPSTLLEPGKVRETKDPFIPFSPIFASYLRLRTVSEKATR